MSTETPLYLFPFLFPCYVHMYLTMFQKISKPLGLSMTVHEEKIKSNQIDLEYNIILPTIEKTGRKPCCIREQIKDIATVSKRDFDSVTCNWSGNVYAYLCIVRASLKRDVRSKYQHLSFLCCCL